MAKKYKFAPEDFLDASGKRKKYVVPIIVIILALAAALINKFGG